MTDSPLRQPDTIEKRRTARWLATSLYPVSIMVRWWFIGTLGWMPLVLLNPIASCLAFLYANRPHRSLNGYVDLLVTMFIFVVLGMIEWLCYGWVVDELRFQMRLDALKASGELEDDKKGRTQAETPR